MTELRTHAHSHRLRTRTVLTAAALAVGATVTGALGSALLTPPARALVSPAPPGVSDPAAAQAITALLGPQPDDPATLPRGFAREAGYQPVVVDGLLVNPDGGCSSPIPLPREFDIPCKAHDLGYDLLRYGQHHSAAPGAWARQGLDARLDQRMHDACTTRPDGNSRTACYTMADVATSAVDMNSWRQGYGDPVQERLGAYGAVGAGTGLIALAWYSRRRRVRGPVDEHGSAVTA